MIPPPPSPRAEVRDGPDLPPGPVLGEASDIRGGSGGSRIHPLLLAALSLGDVKSIPVRVTSVFPARFAAPAEEKGQRPARDHTAPAEFSNTGKQKVEKKKKIQPLKRLGEVPGGCQLIQDSLFRNLTVSLKPSWHKDSMKLGGGGKRDRCSRLRLSAES